MTEQLNKKECVASKKNDTHELIFERDMRLTDLEIEFMAIRRGGTEWESGIDMHTLLFLKEITNKNLMHSTGNLAQYSVIT